MAKYFKLFACCIPVKGAKRATICDLQRNTYFYINLELFTLFNSKTFFNIEKYDNNTIEIFHYLVEQEYGFFTSSPEKFPTISYSSDKEIPMKVTTIIIDLNHKSNYDLEKLAKEIKLLRLYAIELRFFDTFNLENIYKIIHILINRNIRTIHLVIKKNQWITSTSLTDLIDTFKCITQITCHSAKQNKVVSNLFRTSIIYTKEIINDETHCGNIAPFYFESNTRFFKNRTRNSCLSDKIGIDTKGNIKNCPSMNIRYGNINDTALIDVIKKENFIKVGGINKDEIKTCKDCEFRYICLDCRAYTNNNDLYEKPSKCTYNPYTNEWES